MTETKTKEFPTADVMSPVTGRLMGKIDGVYMVLNSMTGESTHFAFSAGLPPIAVPITVKIPEPITAPIPRAVSETGPSSLRKACSGRSESAMSLSMDLVAKICLGSGRSSQRRMDGC